jgi:hypothetical protein
MNGPSQWLIGILIAVFISLLGYIWVDREGRLTDLERRVEIREQEWHRARYALQDKIHEIEYDIKWLKARLPPERRVNPEEGR